MPREGSDMTTSNLVVQMAKYRRVKYRRRGAKKSMGGKRRRSIKSKSLSRRVSRLEKNTRSISAVVNFRQAHQNTIVGDYQVWPLTNYANLAPIFGSVPIQYNKESCRHISVGMDLRISMANEYDKTTYTMFVVSLKDVATTIFDPVNGNLSLTNQQHYTILDGMAMINKEFFNIHKIKRFSTGNQGLAPNVSFPNLGFPSTVEQGEQALRRDHRFYMKQRIGTFVKNTASTWQSLGANPDPSKNYYLIIFSDNSALDLASPTITANFVHSIRV